MFKKLMVSVVLGLSLPSSVVFAAETSGEPMLVAKIQVENQLSISAHQVGDASFIHQIETPKAGVIAKQKKADLPLSKAAVLWVMAFALLFFVIRGTARRIK